eukprot:9006070-Karenia_brevis.AAC.1
MSKCYPAVRREKAKGARNLKARILITRRAQHSNASGRKNIRLRSSEPGGFGRYSEGGSSGSRSEQPRATDNYNPPPSTESSTPLRPSSSSYQWRTSYQWRHMAGAAEEDHRGNVNNGIL